MTRAPLSRAARAGRGAVASAGATLVAAASHTLAGGTVTWLAVAATTILALPVCVLLAGRIGSLWRLGIAVSTAQLLYHWSFSGLGAAGGAAPAAEPLPAHAAHLATLMSFAPAAQAGAVMWAGHGIAAILTVLLLHFGERAWIALGRLVRRLLPPLSIRIAHAAPRRTRLSPLTAPALCPLVISPGAITHRGPPVR